MRKQLLLAVGLCFASTTPLDAAIPFCATDAQRSAIQAAMADPAKPAPYRVAATVTVPAKATLVVISRDTAIWLEEADVLRLTASANLYLEGVVSYDLVS